MAPQFVDISSFQGPVDWPAYVAWARQWDGIARIAMKATEGVGFTDPMFAANRAGALNAGVDTIIYYHFGRPDLGNSAIAETNSLYNALLAIRPSDVVALDIEVAASSEWVYQWLATVEGYFGRKPILYASLSFINQNLQDTRLAQYPLWLADWQFTPDERPTCPPPWSQYEFLQYTDKATNIPGITGNVDADIFLGGQNVNNITYGPNSPDFGNWFIDNGNGTWTCNQTNVVIIGGNLVLFQKLSIDGNTLPVIGLPVENEQYHTESDNYQWSSQQCERATIVYDPANRFDKQPGMGTSYLKHINPPQTVTVETVPDALKADLQALPAALTSMVTKLLQDAGLPTS